MGKMSRDKGALYERELVNEAKKAGLFAQRVPLSGATSYAKGDVEITPGFDPNGKPWVFEAKRRKELPVWLLEALGENHGLILRADNEKSVAIIPLTTLLELMQ
jgi:Holliday junction resolvase